MSGEELVEAIRNLLSSSTGADTHFLTNTISVTYTRGEINMT